MRNRLLLVDGDPRSLRVLDVSLRGAGFDIDAVGDGVRAWQALQASFIDQTASYDLLITSAELGGLDGFELCRRVRNEPTGVRFPILVLSASGSRNEKLRALEAGADEVLAKPAYLKDVTARVRSLLQRRDRDALDAGKDGVPTVATAEHSGVTGATPFTGDLAEIGVVDLVQLIENKGRSGIAHLRGPAGSAAFVYFRDGKVIDAEAGRLSGLDALARVFSWTSGGFEVEWKNVRRKDALARAPAEIIHDGIQRLDAWNELRAQLADANVVFEVDYRLLAERLAEIPDEVNGILRLCDGVRTVLQVVEEASMPDTEALTTLLRLREEGIVHDKTRLSPRDSAVPAPRLESWPAATTSPFNVAVRAPRAVADSPAPPGPAGGERMSAKAGAAPEPEAPRRTAPGLGRPAPGNPGGGAPDEDPVSFADEPAVGGEDNVIPFPALASPPSLAAQGPAPAGTKPTLVGFEPAAAEVVTIDDMSVTLPLGRAQQAQLALQDLRAHDSDDVDDLAAWAAAAAPEGLARMTETQRGVGPPLPLAPREEPVASEAREPVPSASAEGAAAVDDRSMEESTPPSSMTDPSTAAAERAPVHGATSPGFVPAASPPDATARLSFSNEDLSRKDALDELGLPARGRGLRVLAAALAVGALAAIGAQQLLKRSANHASDGVVRPADTVVATPAAEAPGEATGRPARPAAEPPAVELPGARQAGPKERTASSTSAGPKGHGVDEPTSAPAEAASQPGHAAPAHGSAAPAAAREAGPVTAEIPAARPPVPEARADLAPAEGHQPAGSELADCRAAFARSRWRDAMAACTAATAANPQSAEALNMLAHVELNRGHLAKANEIAQKAVALDPKLADAYVIIGGAHQNGGRNREAKAAYRRYLELAPRGRYADELRSILDGL